MRKTGFVLSALLIAGVIVSCAQRAVVTDRAAAYQEKVSSDFGPQEKAERYTDVAVPRMPAASEKGAFDVGPKLSKYQPYKYELLFTDPTCQTYTYAQTVRSVGGKELKQKPKDVYCFSAKDRSASAKQTSSPQYRLVQWIDDPAIKSIKFTYLSFSNKDVMNALCKAGQRGVNVRFTLDQTSDRSASDALVACSPENIKYELRGGQGEIGYSHNKIMMFFTDTDERRIVFSSGNMSSGVVLHHENWHFITTSKLSHFAYMHECVLDAMWDPATGNNREAYLSKVRSCRANAPAPEESDIKAFFVPGEGVDYDSPASGRSATSWMVYGGNGTPGIRNAAKIWIGCHRFFYSAMIKELKKRMSGSQRPELQIVGDDDTYYVAKDPNFSEGDTLAAEWDNMNELRSMGADVCLMETNPHDHLLHHSKYLLFADKSGQFKSVLCGAANLTGAGFNKNFENLYFVMIPEVVQRFAEHHQMMATTKATKIEDLPEVGKVCDKLDPGNIPANACSK